MSTKINKAKFIEALRNLIKKEIEEVSTSAATPGYMTPMAFDGGKKKHKKKRDDIANQSGLKQVNEVMFAVKVDKGDGDIIQTIINASSKGQAKAKIARILKGGLKAVKDVQRVQPSLGKQIDKKLENVNEGRYHDWRNDETLTPKQKIGKSIREVRNSLNELDKTIKMNLRLKNELNVDSRSYWKNTHKALNSISERLVKLASKVGNLK
jgi:hypothetical protein